MASTGRQQGRVWRARRRWAAMGLPGRIVTAVTAAVVGLFVLAVALGGILSACGVGEEGPQTPMTSDPPAVTSEPADPTTAETPSASATSSPTVTPPPRPAEPDATTTEPSYEESTAEPSLEETSEEPPPNADVYYENCDAARDAGAAPVYRGDAGYGPHLDRDGDGVACEPYVGP